MLEKDKAESKRREESNRPNWECTECHQTSFNMSYDRPGGGDCPSHKMMFSSIYSPGPHSWREIR